MSFELQLTDIIARLRQGRFQNEQAVSQGIVLPNGRTWIFYLPAEQCSYEDRRVYKLDLLERPPAEAADILRRYLAYERVVSGEALDTARKEYRSRDRRSQARAAIPEAWRELDLGESRNEGELMKMQISRSSRLPEPLR